MRASVRPYRHLFNPMGSPDPRARSIIAPCDSPPLYKSSGLHIRPGSFPLLPLAPYLSSAHGPVSVRNRASYYFDVEIIL